MNGDWLHSKRPAPRQDYPRESGPSDPGWAETEPFMEDMLDIDTQYTQQQRQFGGPHYPAVRSMQSNGQYGSRGRPAPQPYSQSHAGDPSRAAEALGSPFDIRSPRTRQGGATRSWLDLNSPELRRPDISTSLEDVREESKREIANLSRRFLNLEEKIAKRNRELEAEVVKLEGQVAKLNDLKLSDVANKLAQGEENFRNQ